MTYAEVVCFDPATIEVFELQDTLPDFHNNEIVNDGSSYLDEDKFEKVLTILSVKEIGYEDCVGYKAPLLFDGRDDPGNLEVVSNEVYWPSQLYQQIKNLPRAQKSIQIKFTPSILNEDLF